MRRVLESLARKSQWLNVALTALVSMVIAYLLEGVLLGRDNSGPPDIGIVWSSNNRPLTILGVGAALLLVAFGASRLYSATLRGIFIHAFSHRPDFIPRHITEHELLRRWAEQEWPMTPVLPFLQSTPAEEGSAGTVLGRQIIRRGKLISQLLPGTGRFTILPSGAPERMVIAGAVVGDSVPTDWLRILGDDSSNSGRGFVEYEVPEVEQRTDLSEGRTVLLLKGRGTEEEPARDLCQDSTLLTVGDGPIEECGKAYLEYLIQVGNELKEVPTKDLMLLSGAPASLTFAAGVMASATGFRVSSRPFDYSIKKYKDPEVTFEPTSGIDRLDARDRGWRWWPVALVSTLSGIATPIFLASLGIWLEWYLGQSQSQRADPLPWPYLWIVLATSGLTLLCALWVTEKLIKGPRVTLVTGTVNHQSTVARRAVQVPSGSDAESWASSITESYCDVAEALPQAQHIEVDLNGLPDAEMAKDVVTGRGFGLDITLRGLKNVTAVWRGQSTTCHPRTGPDPFTPVANAEGRGKESGAASPQAPDTNPET